MCLCETVLIFFFFLKATLKVMYSIHIGKKVWNNTHLTVSPGTGERGLLVFSLCTLAFLEKKFPPYNQQVLFCNTEKQNKTERKTN